MWLCEHAPRRGLVQADGAALPFRRAFDAVFSGATFHWILDHAALFRSIITALKPGGRLVAQCGGAGNLALLRGARRSTARASRASRAFFEEWTEPWYYADVDSTRRRLSAAGFEDIDVSLEAAPTPFDGAEAFQEFIATVCVRHHLEPLPPPERQMFLRELTVAAAADPPPLTLDYWRLNLVGEASRMTPARVVRSADRGVDRAAATRPPRAASRSRGCGWPASSAASALVLVVASRAASRSRPPPASRSLRRLRRSSSSGTRACSTSSNAPRPAAASARIGLAAAGARLERAPGRRGAARARPRRASLRARSRSLRPRVADEVARPAGDDRRRAPPVAAGCSSRPRAGGFANRAGRRRGAGGEARVARGAGDRRAADDAQPRRAGALSRRGPSRALARCRSSMQARGRRSCRVSAGLLLALFSGRRRPTAPGGCSRSSPAIVLSFGFALPDVSRLRSRVARRARAARGMARCWRSSAASRGRRRCSCALRAAMCAGDAGAAACSRSSPRSPAGPSCAAARRCSTSPSRR